MLWWLINHFWLWVLPAIMVIKGWVDRYPGHDPNTLEDQHSWEDEPYPAKHKWWGEEEDDDLRM